MPPLDLEREECHHLQTPSEEGEDYRELYLELLEESLSSGGRAWRNPQWLDPEPAARLGLSHQPRVAHLLTAE